MDGIGERVSQRIKQVRPDALQREIAQAIGMTPDAFSRALNGARHFSSLEMVQLSDLLNTDVYWLITGSPDPHKLRVAARHGFDHDTGHRDVPGRDGDEQTLNDIALAYRQAYPDPEPKPALPATVRAVRAALGEGFVRPFAERLEDGLGIDIVRVKELSTAYSFSVGGRHVIAVPATGNWFRENWSMAHELGHLVLGHHDDGADADVSDEHEAAANSFAAELLLPADQVRPVDWNRVADDRLADLIWSWGVSTDALARRLDSLIGATPAPVERWVGHSTQRLLRHHLPLKDEIDHITMRMDAASQRRFPLSLQEAHLARIERGEIGKRTLAWMLDIDPDVLDVDAPEQSEPEPDQLASALGL
ncbi:XRE family transcriptional regulator [Saccharopolyspora sp. ID03-671]|uniref:ImmA/IrrE family metallo-endopeptidase n=1 Tax=Saccharopolyspora sp. ID03-671 TaxID=3073066 RepID=UPI003252CEDD